MAIEFNDSNRIERRVKNSDGVYFGYYNFRGELPKVGKINTIYRVALDGCSYKWDENTQSCNKIVD